MRSHNCAVPKQADIDGILPKGSYPPCLRKADRAFFAGYHRYVGWIHVYLTSQITILVVVWLAVTNIEIGFIMGHHWLIHWDRYQTASILQTTFSKALSWMKMFEFHLRFHWSLSLGVQLRMFQHWFRYWLSADHATNHYLNQWCLVSWRIIQPEWVI